MRPETFEQLEQLYCSASSELGRQIGHLAAAAAEDRREQLRAIERARAKRDVAARALRLARLEHLRGHPQAGERPR